MTTASAGATASDSRREGWRRPAVLGGAIGIAGTAFTLFCVFVGRRFFQPRGVSGAEALSPGGWFLPGLVQWDSGWYAEIAEGGYWYRPDEAGPTAFFPGYPAAVRLAHELFGVHAYVAGVWVSLVCGLAATVMLALWIDRVWGPRMTAPATLAFVVYPFSFFLFGPMYSESFFVAIAVSAFYCLERRWLVPAVLLAAVATATRPVAPAIVAGLFFRHWELKRAQGRPLQAVDALLLLSAAGMGAYVAFLWWKFGDPLAFARVQSAPGWDHTPGWRTWLKLRFFAVMSGRLPVPIKITYALHAGLGIGALLLAIRLRRMIGWGYALYVALAMGIPLIANKDFFPVGRYVVGAFPCAAALASLWADRPALRSAWLAASAVMFAFLAAQYGRGVFVG